MKYTDFEQGRIYKSAKALKAFFEQKLNTTLELLATKPEPIGDGDVQFSLAMSQYGLWGVRAPQPLAATESVEIYDTFQTILGNIARMEERRTELERIEQLLEDMPSNVIQMRRRGSLKAVAPEQEKRWMLRLDCLIESNHVSEIHKMALELHSHSARYAFLEYRDLNSDQRKFLPELLALGAISLFVPDILLLSADEQVVLRQLMAVETLNRPLLMVGTNLPFAELRRVAGVDLEFLALLSRAYIKLTRPFSEYKQQGLIHYFLDSLSQNPS